MSFISAIKSFLQRDKKEDSLEEKENYKLQKEHD